MHKLLRLQHHRHTGRRLEHHHTSYRGLLLVALALALSLSLMQKTGAETLEVNPQIYAPAPTLAPTIDRPVNGATFSEPVLAVSGTCEILTPSYVVTLWADKAFAGSAPCNQDGTFSAAVSLSAGAHALRTGSLTIGDKRGPDGSPVNVTRTQSQPSNSQDTALQPVVLLRDVQRVIFTPGKTFKLGYEIKQGTAPYQLDVDWGDGNSETHIIRSPGSQKLEHDYNFPRSYTITLKLADSKSQTFQMVLAAQTFAGPAAPANYNIGPAASETWLDNIHGYVWGAYGAAMMGMIAFWIGEHLNVFKHAHLQLEHGKKHKSGKK